ncbi:MAG: hypothetical protein QOK42_1055 [Frankiaceae bacterium]|nr:hypothetical protein [Frankiaceae bacterium]MDX6224733.1 hypothetical protein [Frankiales bacterium]
MIRRALAGLVVAGAALVGSSAPATADPIPPSCPEGGLGTADCPYIDNTDSGFGSGDSDPSGMFAGFFLLALLVGGGTMLYKVSVAKDMARRAGLDEHDAAVATVFSEDGLAATYIASSLQPRHSASAAAPPAQRSVESRLAELKRLRDKGLVSAGEYDARRDAILAEL